MKKIFNSTNRECRFLSGSPLRGKIRNARRVNRGTDSFYRSSSFNYNLI